jgi:hypothetical protein
MNDVASRGGSRMPGAPGHSERGATTSKDASPLLDDRQSVGFAELTAAFSHVRRASQADNPGILALLDETAMAAGNLALRYDRAPDFFRFLKCQGDTQVAVVSESDSGKIEMVSALSLRDGLHEGRPVRIGYLGDLRVAPRASRAARVEWRKYYEAFLRTVGRNRDLGGCDFLYTAILKENKAAIQALVRRDRGVRYEPIYEYSAVSMLANRPLAYAARLRRPARTRGYRLESLDPANLDELARFLATASAGLDLGYRYPQELHFRLRAWPGFSLDRFLVARDPAGRIVAALAPWSPGEARRLIVDRLPPSLRVLFRLLGILGLHTVRESEELNICYLTHQAFDPELDSDQRGRLFRAMVDELFARGVFMPYHAVTFVDRPEAPLRPYLKGYVTHETEGLIYQVSHEGMATGRGSAMGRPLALEIATL